MVLELLEQRKVVTTRYLSLLCFTGDALSRRRILVFVLHVGDDVTGGRCGINYDISGRSISAVQPCRFLL